MENNKTVKMFEEWNSLNSENINEGQFGWITFDNVQTKSYMRETYYMFDDKGNKWVEDEYQGYGVFGGKDYYELLAEMNGLTASDDEIEKAYGNTPEEKYTNCLRQKGIDLVYGKGTEDENTSDFVETQGIKYPALFANPNEFVLDSHDFTKSPQSDPNQSWEEDEEDDYYDDEDDYYDDEDDDMYEGKKEHAKDDKFIKGSLKKALKDEDSKLLHVHKDKDVMVRFDGDGILWTLAEIIKTLDGKDTSKNKEMLLSYKGKKIEVER